jgi:hypothetical protein
MDYFEKIVKMFNLKSTLYFIFILLGVFIFYCTAILKFDLANLSSLFSIISSLSIGVAIVAYFYQKNKDEFSAAIDQISFFRQDIINEAGQQALNKIRQKEPNFVISRISLAEPSLEIIKAKFLVNFNRQLDVFFKIQDNGLISLDSEVLNSQVFLLNMLEEFSLRVIHLNTINNPALKPLHGTFIELVEQNADALLFMRDIKVGQSIYVEILKLYNMWRDDSENQNLIKNLLAHGLITEKQKKEFYKSRRENHGF